WVALLSWPLLRVRPSLSVWVAAGCGVLGVAMIQSPHFEAGPQATLAVALSLTAALTSAVAMLGLHRLKDVHPWAIVAHYSGVATGLAPTAWMMADRAARGSRTAPPREKKFVSMPDPRAFSRTT